LADVLFHVAPPRLRRPCQHRGLAAGRRAALLGLFQAWRRWRCLWDGIVGGQLMMTQCFMCCFVPFLIDECSHVVFLVENLVNVAASQVDAVIFLP
jgi:hypothetical protein